MDQIEIKKIVEKKKYKDRITYQVLNMCLIKGKFVSFLLKICNPIHCIRKEPK